MTQTTPHISGIRGHGTRLVKFGLVGVLNTGVDFLVYAIVVVMGVSPALANVMAFGVANPFSFIVNAQTTFRGENGAAEISMTRYGKFLVAHLFSLALSTAVVFFLAAALGAFAAKLAAVVVTLAINYLASAYLVFPSKAKTPD